MNTAVDTTRRFDEWPDEITSSWTPTLFTSPFGEAIPVPDAQLWTTPGNNSEEFHKSSQRATREQLAHGIDSTANFDTGYTIDNAAGAGAFVYDHYPGAHPTGQSHRHELDYPFAGDSRGPDNIEHAGDGSVFSDNTIPLPLISSTNDHFSPHYSEATKFSPRSTSGVSPASGSSVNWMADGADQQSPSSPACSLNAPLDPMPPTKHRRNRERNRVAAHKCRQKAKQSMTELQARERELSQQNRLLQEHAGNLRDEILDLKNEILRHSSCDSDIIQNYIARAARDVH